ncbi:MAG: hypothetical protein ACOCX7_02430, partial [Bacteroidota bacterium]
VEKMPGEIVSLGQQPETIGDYATLTACDSEYADSIIVMSNSTTASIASASLEVLQRYTLIVADSAQKNAAQSILVEPPIIDRDPGARAMVRVVNAAWNREQLTVTLGARVDTAFANGYNSGYVVAEDLTYGAVSELKFLNPGLAPIAMFTSGTPSKLLSTGNYEFLSGLNYLLIITSDDQGRDRLTVVEDDEINRNAEYLGSGVFTQVINALPANENIDISLPPLMDQSTIYYTGSMATPTTLILCISPTIRLWPKRHYTSGGSSMPRSRCPRLPSKSTTKSLDMWLAMCHINRKPRQWRYTRTPKSASCSIMRQPTSC